jgi:hypothetical protein
MQSEKKARMMQKRRERKEYSVYTISFYDKPERLDLSGNEKPLWRGMDTGCLDNEAAGIGIRKI